MTTQIHYVVYQQHLDGDGSTTDAQADGYAANLAEAIRREYPQAEVRVEVRRHVQGVGSGLQGEPEGVNPDLLHPRTGRCRDLDSDTSQAPLTCTAYDGPPLHETDDDEED